MLNNFTIESLRFISCFLMAGPGWVTLAALFWNPFKKWRLRRTGIRTLGYIFRKDSKWLYIRFETLSGEQEAKTPCPLVTPALPLPMELNGKPIYSKTSVYYSPASPGWAALWNGAECLDILLRVCLSVLAWWWIAFAVYLMYFHERGQELPWIFRILWAWLQTA